jgi:hypothetical protein
MMKTNQSFLSSLSFVVCVDNTDYPASLEKRKIYEVLPDEQAEQHSMVRVVDESGEDYLYPSDYFLAVELPQSVQQALALAA